MSDTPPPDQPHKIVDEAEAPATKLEAERDKAASDYEKQGGKDGQLSMAIRIRSPFKSYFDGPAFSISGLNATGPFDILPKHHNFISLLDACELTVRSEKGDEKIQIGGGLMHVKSDQVLVFLDV